MKTIKTNLCIGGPLDGQRIQRPEGETNFCTAERLGPVDYSFDPDVANMAVEMKTHTYRQSKIYGQKSTWLVWLHEDRTSDDGFKALLDCYAASVGGADV